MLSVGRGVDSSVAFLLATQNFSMIANVELVK